MALTTDATPRVYLTEAQVINDESRMNRLIATFCDGLFSYADEETATRIVDEARQICGASTDTFASVLQTKFFMDHTPMHWTIVNREGGTGTPPLLEKLLAACGPQALDVETQVDIVDAFCVHYDSDLYLTIKSKLLRAGAHCPYAPSYFKEHKDRPVLTASLDPQDTSKVKIGHTIPRLFDRLAIEREVALEFLALEHMCTFSAFRMEATSSSPLQWGLQLNLCRARSTQCSEGVDRWYLYNFELIMDNGCPVSLSQTTDWTQSRINFRLPNKLSRFHSNAYTANESRALTGTITLRHARW